MIQMGSISYDGFFVLLLLNSSIRVPKCALKKNVYLCEYDPSMLHDIIYCNNYEEAS